MKTRYRLSSEIPENFREEAGYDLPEGVFSGMSADSIIDILCSYGLSGTVSVSHVEGDKITRTEAYCFGFHEPREKLDHTKVNIPFVRERVLKDDKYGQRIDRKRDREFEMDDESLHSMAIKALEDAAA